MLFYHGVLFGHEIPQQHEIIRLLHHDSILNRFHCCITKSTRRSLTSLSWDLFCIFLALDANDNVSFMRPVFSRILSSSLHFLKLWNNLVNLLSRKFIDFLIFLWITCLITNETRWYGQVNMAFFLTSSIYMPCFFRINKIQ